MPPKPTHTPVMIELSSDSEDDFDAPIGQPTTSRHFKRPPTPAPLPPAKKPRLSTSTPASTAAPGPGAGAGAKSNTGGWAPAELERLLDMYDSNLQASGTADYGRIVEHFPGRSRKDLHAAVYRARKKKGGRASVLAAGPGVEEVVSEAGTAKGTPSVSEGEVQVEADAEPAPAEPIPKAEKPTKPRTSTITPWLPADLARLIAAYDDTVAAHGRPRYDLITPHFPGRTKEALQSQVSGFKKKAARAKVGGEGGGDTAAGGVASTALAPAGGIQKWLAQPARPKPRPRLTEAQRRFFGKQCRAVLRLLEAHAAVAGVITVE